MLTVLIHGKIVKLQFVYCINSRLVYLNLRLIVEKLTPVTRTSTVADHHIYINRIFGIIIY